MPWPLTLTSCVLLPCPAHYRRKRFEDTGTVDLSLHRLPWQRPNPSGSHDNVPLKAVHRLILRLHSRDFFYAARGQGRDHVTVSFWGKDIHVIIAYHAEGVKRVQAQSFDFTFRSRKARYVYYIKQDISAKRRNIYLSQATGLVFVSLCTYCLNTKSITITCRCQCAEGLSRPCTLYDTSSITGT